jgi:major membrane immunogen (membrane-anchored lipoprotein)
MKSKAILPALIALLLTACASSKYQRMITKPDGSYKIIPTDQKELDMTVDGDTTHKNFDILKYCNASARRQSPFKYLP